MYFLALEGNRIVSLAAVQEVWLTGDNTKIECEYVAAGRTVRGIVFAEDVEHPVDSTGEARTIFQRILESGVVFRPSALLAHTPPVMPEVEESATRPVSEEWTAPAEAEAAPEPELETVEVAPEPEPEPETAAQEAPAEEKPAPRKVVRRKPAKAKT